MENTSKASMIEDFLIFPILLKNSEIKFNKIGLLEVIQEYSFFHLYENIKLKEESKQIIEKNIKESHFIIIAQNQQLNEETNKTYLQVCFEKTIIILEQSSTSTSSSFFKNLISTKPKKKIYLLPNTKLNIISSRNINNDDENHPYEIIESDRRFYHEIESFIESCPINQDKNIRQVWKLISPCITGYLIKKSYSKCEQYRIERFINEIANNSSVENIKKNEYVELRTVGNGSTSICTLIYHIKKGELCVIKKVTGFDIESSTLKERETKNYSRIKHPLLPRYYGKIENEGNIVIEFIEGQTLDMINKMQLTTDDKLKIIFELMMIIQYFHEEGLIYRDLKPNNIIIDENKTVNLIDFDRLIEENAKYEHTLDLNESQYFAPEVSQTGKYTYESDIYSLGKVIEFIMKQEETEIKQYTATVQSNNAAIKDIISKCTDLNSKNRPTTSELINDFCLKFQAKIKIEQSIFTYEEHSSYFELINKLNRNDPEAHFILGNFYYKSIYVPQDISKAIYYYSIAASQNHPRAQLKLAAFYYEGEYVTCDINKAIHYFSLAANQNCPDAQFCLGFIHYEGQYIRRDIDKAIHYYSLAANQNHPEAQYNLGFIYDEGKFVRRDISKAIYYYSLAANQNKINAQLALGFIYHKSRYPVFDINKAIHYYSLAASQNDSQAQFKLGIIYYEDKYVKRDIDKAIHYFSLAADQNYPEAQFNLGLIYYEGKYVRRDIAKVIHYYSLAANHNFPQAQYNLGIIYNKGIYVTRDIGKAINYYTLAANHNLPQAQYNLGFIYDEGQFVARDINKSIHYYTLAAKQNHLSAQLKLGFIYLDGQYVTRDISKSIHYYTLAANQNHPEAQFKLGFIYDEGRYVKRDIYKAIHYYSQAANQNYLVAQFFLGMIFYEGRYVKRNIDKAIHYYSLAANQNYTNAQFFLGLIYYERGSSVDDVNKAIHFFTLAANKNLEIAQLYLGIIYYIDRRFPKDIEKGRYYIMLASKNGNRRANFMHGFLLHEGKNVERDIEGAIHYYKEASTFNIPFAKNNLGIIYKHGINNQIEKKIGSSIIYFEEAIRQKNDCLSMYNLAHILFYEESFEHNIDKSIELLIKSSNLFYHSNILLSIILVQQIGKNIDKIKQEIEQRTNNNNKLAAKIIQIVRKLDLFNETKFLEIYSSYKNIDFLYDAGLHPILSSEVEQVSKKEINPKYTNAQNITSFFYEGFGFDI